MTRDVWLRFWSKVALGDGCWEWRASAARNGYGQFMLPGNSIQRSHRFAWTLARGPVPAGLCVCHRCDNRRCVRPSHLFLGTVGDNNSDMLAKGRHVSGFVVSGPKRGSRNPVARLNEASVLDARRRYSAGERAEDLAARYGVAVRTIYNVLSGHTWRHVCRS